MSVREKLMELLKNAKSAMKSENLSCDIERNMFVVDFMIANGVTVQEWIPVVDRLPECEGSYIVYTERGSIYSSHFYTEKRFASGYVRKAQWSKRGTVKVTHWIPLPEPPKGE